MQDTSINFDEITELMIENNCLMELMQGYCTAFAEDINEINNLLTIFETLIKNHNLIWSKLNQIEGDVLKITYPEFFEQ